MKHILSGSFKDVIGPISVKAAVAELMVMTLFVYIGTGTATTFGATKGYEFKENPAGNVTNVGDVQGNVAKVTDNLLTNGSWGVTTAFAFGLAITAMAFASGHISGGQMNPAVTLALFLAGSLGLAQAVANITAQIVGSILASGLVYATIPNAGDSALGSNQLADSVSTGNAVCGEVVMTYVLVMVVLQVAGSTNSVTRSQAPLAIGFAVFCAHAVLLPIDGCSINPARSLGPAIVSGTWGDFWVFIVGPFSGAILAVPFYVFFKCEWDTAKAATDPMHLEEVGAGRPTKVTVEQQGGEVGMVKTTVHQHVHDQFGVSVSH